MRAHKTEFFPDGFDKKGNPIGPRTMVLHFFIPNSKRWRKLNTEEKAHAFTLLAQFKDRLTATQKELFPDADI